MEFLERVLRKTRVVNPLKIESDAQVTLVPLSGGGDADADLLSEATNTGATIVSEVSESGDVNRVLVRHAGPQPLLLLHGEELLGAKQNRILNASFLVAPGEAVEIPASCVERGRWGYSSREFSSSGTTVASQIRSRSLKRVARSVMMGGSLDAKQSAVWRDVDAYLSRTRTVSPTASHFDAASKHLGEARMALSKIELDPSSVGVAFVRGDRLVSLDLFGSPSLFARAWKKLGLGVLSDVYEESITPADPRAVAQDALDDIRTTPLRKGPAVGIGETLHGGGNVAVGAVVEGGQLYHLYAAHESRE